eukprot:TRINITY_DN2_c0_g3_i1.p1 TRINITY_DN2_c0_g3~~TRINITY_DN2_c0_g3_i1.p1  ORF type:complete len:575 (+),score=98.31 TRINITY_DN2_c0_g3_i1:37-1725(+)
MDPELQLANDSEKLAVSEIKQHLDAELKQLAAEGKDFPHTTGDIFFTRCLRGNNGDKDEAIKWFRKFMELRSKFGLDDIHTKMDADKTPFVNTNMPHSEEVLPYCNTVFDEENLRTPSGHVVWYDALGDWRTKSMLDKLGPEKYIEFMQHTCERRTSMLDKLSRRENRMVKMLKIMDFEATGLWMLNKDYKQVQDTHVEPVLFGTSIETVHLIFLINFPSIATQLFNILSRVMPARLTKRIRILGTDYMQNKEFLTEVGPELTSKLLAMNKSHNDSNQDSYALEGKSQLVAATAIMERTVAVSPGQQVCWEFRVAKPGEIQEKRSFFGKIATMATSMMEGTEVVFSVSSIWTDVDPNDIGHVPAKVRSAGVNNGDAAEFWVDGQAIDFAAGTGVNIVALNPKTKEHIFKTTYDVVNDSEAANEKLAADLKALSSGSMVLVAVKGTGAEKLSDDAWYYLRCAGASISAGHWQSGYALIGCKGGSTGGLRIAEKMGPEVMVEGNVPTMELEAELCSPVTIDADSPVTQGSTGPVTRGGLVVVRWSNAHSFVTRKMISDFKVFVE